jgi:hypothetical protein
MKKVLLSFTLLTSIISFSQDHFSGIATSKRVGILNAGLNPSELANLNNHLEIQFFSSSVNISNNKINFKDIINGSNLDNLMFKGTDPVNFNIDTEIVGPGFAVKLLNWGFAVTSKGYIKGNIIDVDPNLGSALTNGVLSSISSGTALISSNTNQRMNATTWGEIGFSAAHKIFENKKSKINAGVTFKLLFPGAYANVGLDKFQGSITTNSGNLVLTNATANLNIAYSGNLGNAFTNVSDYTSSVFGNLQGVATDIGVDYQLLGSNKNYKVKIGASLKNIGSMTFKSSSNYSTNYTLSIPGNRSLNLNQFQNFDGINDIETTLVNSGFLNNTPPQKSDFTVKLPTTFNLYADIKIVSKLSVTLFTQQKVNSDSNNDQIMSQNIISITPRVSLGLFEAYIPIAKNEISGTTGGFGFRLGGFFLGSNSILTAITSDTKQADFYTGFRFGIL